MPDLRKIQIPNSIKMAFQGQEQEYTFFMFVQHFMDTQPAYNDDAAGIKAGLVLDSRMREAMKEAQEHAESVAAKEGGEEAPANPQPKELLLDEPDWMRLNNTVQSPSKLKRQDTGQEVSGYPFTPARIFGEFIEAIEKAEKV